MKKKQPKKSKKERLHPEMKGFKIEIDTLGKVQINKSADELSDFLKRHMKPDSNAATNSTNEEE